MNRNEISISLAGASVRYELRFPETGQYFKKYIETPSSVSVPAVRVTEEAFENWCSQGNSWDAFGEFCLLCQPTSEALMEQDRCVFHAAALRFRDKAFLIAGGSGAGKSTHCRKLLADHPDELSVINGDKPVLEYRSGTILVHPSPWNGKEGLYGAPSAPLAGIFILRRGEKNTVEPCTNGQAAIFTFPLVFQSFETEAMIRLAGNMTEKIVSHTPCCFFDSRDIEPSSRLLYKAIREECENEL